MESAVFKTIEALQTVKGKNDLETLNNLDRIYYNMTTPQGKAKKKWPSDEIRDAIKQLNDEEKNLIHDILLEMRTTLNDHFREVEDNE